MPKTEIENVLQPGKTYRVDSARFLAMREAYLAAVPAAAPGATPAEILGLVRATLPEDLFPCGDKAGWWAKAVQLDLEAKGIVRRGTAGPVRLFRV